MEVSSIISLDLKGKFESEEESREFHAFFQERNMFLESLFYKTPNIKFLEHLKKK